MFQYFVMLIVLSFLFTSLSNISKRSVWPPVVLHASFNISNLIIGTVYPADGGFEVKDWNYLIVLLVMIVLGVYFFKGQVKGVVAPPAKARS